MPTAAGPALSAYHQGATIKVAGVVKLHRAITMSDDAHHVVDGGSH